MGDKGQKNPIFPRLGRMLCRIAVFFTKPDNKKFRVVNGPYKKGTYGRALVARTQEEYEMIMEPLYRSWRQAETNCRIALAQKYEKIINSPGTARDIAALSMS